MSIFARGWPNIVDLRGGPSRLRGVYDYLLVARAGEWTERDTELCREAIASGMVYNKATGRPLTVAETQAQYDEYAPVRAGLVDYETFSKDRIEVRPFEDRRPDKPCRTAGGQD